MNRRQAVIAAPLLLPMSGCARRPDTTPGTLAEPREGQHPFTIEDPDLPEPVRLWLSLPTGYAQGERPWPLVVFLHGSGERGQDLSRVLAHGLPKLAARGAVLPFVLASPQLDGWRWQPAQLHALLFALRRRLRIDAERVCATGLSLGGHGVWDWASAWPGDLAAIAPVCGFGNPAAVCRARRVPVRAYHGDLDTIVPLARQQQCIDALRACGGVVDFHVLRGVGHDAWNPAYDDPALVPWLMAQVRQPSAPTHG